ncbi:MAG: type I glutamate--ammonia ligase [Acidilobaceae archaeon]
MSGPFKRVQVQYTDLAGFLRGVEVSYESIEENEFPVAFDGSSVFGLAEIEESDLLLNPVRETLKPIPWARDMARVLTRIYKPSRVRHSRDPRFVAEKTMDYLTELGFKPKVGVELEFFLFESVSVDVFNPSRGLGYTIKSHESPGSKRAYFTLTKRAYHSVDPIDSLSTFRLEYAKALEILGFSSEYTHHEVAVSQVESSLRAGDPVYAGDEVVTAKWVARNIAKSLGLIAVFLPKPVYGDNGSGLHIHLSLWDLEGKRNLFQDNSSLSNLARYFIGGILEHSRSLAAIVAPTTNSYRRLVPGYEAPVYCTWGFHNRSTIIRVPVATNENKVRVEFRAPDPTANPYLAISATILAGIDGLRKRIEPGEPVNINVYKLTREDLRKMNIKTLPSSLSEALDELESDNEYLKPVFTDDLIETYIEIKRREVEEVNMRPHPYEFYQYLNL